MRTSIGIAACVWLAMAGGLGGDSIAEARNTHPHFSDGGTLDWAPTLSTAKAWARERGKLIFVEVGNPRCPNCRVLCSDVVPHPQVKQRMRDGFVGLAPDSRFLHASVRRLFMNNVPRHKLRVLPWVAFLTADGQFITGWGGYTTVSQLESHLAIAESRRTRTTERAETAPRAGAVPPAPGAPPPADTRRKVLMSSEDGGAGCVTGNCGDTSGCENGMCEAPPCDGGAWDSVTRDGVTRDSVARDRGACADGSCDAPGVTKPDPVLGPMIPWVPGSLPKAPKTDAKAPMASKSDVLYAVGSPDAETIVDSSSALPPPTVRRVVIAPAPEYHPSCDASDLLTGDPDAEVILRVPATPPVTKRDPVARAEPTDETPAPERPIAGAMANARVDAVIAAARRGDGDEAQRLLHGSQADPTGLDALADWREIRLMPNSSLVRKHMIARSRERYAGTAWAKLFK